MTAAVPVEETAAGAPGPVRRIAVLRCNAFGDYLMATPALAALRVRFPEAEQLPRGPARAGGPRAGGAVRRRPGRAAVGCAARGPGIRAGLTLAWAASFSTTRSALCREHFRERDRVAFRSIIFQFVDGQRRCRGHSGWWRGTVMVTVQRIPRRRRQREQVRLNSGS
ncbi:hypothetical protein [Pseudonocardia sp.]|uniref:hypothetical protein n=1 Tax=Pseudonocardia sp. TaxID=60912 RepID=UPI0031FD665E